MTESEYRTRAIRSWQVILSWIAGFVLSLVFVLRIHEGVWPMILSILVAVFMATFMAIVIPFAVIARGRIGNSQ